MKSELRLIAAFLFPFVAFGQPVNNLINDVVQPAPNAASLGKYGDIPVSYFTGVPNISIPIHTIVEGSLTLPISLSYHAGGVRVGENGSWAGLGWSVNAGGMVSRTVMGRPDERSNGYLTIGSSIALPSTCANDPIIGEIASGNKDGEPDLFSYSAGTYSGKFYFKANGTVVLVPKQDVIIKPVYLNGTVGAGISAANNLLRFIITTPDGNRYFFGDTGDNDPAIEYQENSSMFKQASSWYLKKIESADGKFSIKLKYSNERYAYRSSPTKTDGMNGGNAFPYNEIWIDGYRLAHMASSTDSVVFVAGNNREDIRDHTTVPGARAKELDKINIMTKGTGFCKTFDLFTSYYTDNSVYKKNWEEDKRLRLDSLKELSCTGASIALPPHRFTYFTKSGDANFLPHRLSRAIDHWGYYNGADANNITTGSGLNIPYTRISYNLGQGPIVVGMGNSNRETSEAPMKYGTLQRITYPTGGYSEFDFEANEFYDTLGVVTLTPTSFDLNWYWPGGQCATTWPAIEETWNFSTADLPKLRYTWMINGFNGFACCTNGSVEIKVVRASDNYSLGTVSLNNGCSNPAADTTYGFLTALIPNLQPEIDYKFSIRGFNSASFFKLDKETTSVVNTNRKVGGLRVKQILNHDAATNSNDVIRTYAYHNINNTSRSSAKLYNKPVYGYGNSEPVFATCLPNNPTSGYYLFTDAGVVPLSSFEGYHVGYMNVTESFNGNGSKVYGFEAELPVFPHFNSLPPSNGISANLQTFPVPPIPAMNYTGNTASTTTKNSSGSTVAYEFTNPKSEIYELSTDVYIKAMRVSSILHAFSTYKNRTSPPYRALTVTSTMNGVTTTKTYEYSNASYLFPTAEVLTNSDGIDTRNEYKYSHDYTASTAMRDSLLRRNILMPAWKTTIKVGGTEVDGSEMEYAFFHLSSGAQQPTGAGSFPRIHKFYDFEKTWDAAGTLTGTGKTLKATILDYDGTTGKPKTFRQVGWKPEQYTWNSSGLITKRSFNYNDGTAYRRFETNYEYHTGTRLLKKITAVDGQFTEYAYDVLQRLDSVKVRKVGNVYNVVTKYTYQYKGTGVPRSYVKSRTAYTATSGSSLTEKTIWQYFDGLGRPVQTVDQKHSPGQKDVISNITYDNQGRQDSAFVVYENPDSPGNAGAFRAAIPVGTKFTLTQYESSPLNRSVSVTPPSWYATTTVYGANTTADSVIMSHAASPTYYGANLLNKVTATDPNNNKSVSFTDKKGRVVLTRRTDSANSFNSRANTYNIYDNKDRLKTVVPPSATIANNALLFKYLYDQSDNMTMKDVPDAAPMTMKYDTSNLMTLMQDSNLLVQGKWLGTKYDLYGRASATGFATGTDANTFTIASTDTLTRTTYDLSGQNIYKGKVRQSKVKILDGGNNFITTNFTYDAHGRVSSTTATNHLLTTNADVYNFTYDWADNRITSTRNHKRRNWNAATTVKDSTTYDHAGRVKLNLHRIGTSGAFTTLSELNYTAKDELMEKNLGKVTCSSSSFAANVAPGDCWLQSIDYLYNAQGWLTTINQAALASTGTPVTLASCTAPTPSTTGNENDLFYLELLYDSQFPGMTTNDSIHKNGNINQLMWRTRGRERQGYNFSYDHLDRLRSAAHADVNETGTVTFNNRFNESLTYNDLRGNIKTLKRQGATTATGCTFAQTDNLTYNYTAGTNRISSIADAAPAASKARGFNPGGGTGSYAYDKNGNMTTDPYKALTIAYNHLNLPTLFTWTSGSFSGNTVEIVYDAAGTKLKKIVKTGATVNYTQDYIAGIEYRDTVREAIYHAEGRVFNNAGTNRYEYTIKDHLGNARISFTDKDSDGLVEVFNTTANEVLQENHYYPFGLNYDGPWMNDAARDNKYQYNGKEWNDDFGLNLNDYGARWYDAAVGRWWSVDPLADKYKSWSPYNYAMNNPVRFIDPDGRSATDIYIGKDGKYLGQDGAKTNDVRVINEKQWNGFAVAGGEKSEIGTKGLQSLSTKLENYGEGINISEGTWGKVEAAGGDRIEPTVENGSDATIYYKPDGPPHDDVGNATGPNPNPGKDVGGAYPIAAGANLYAPIDGVKTTGSPDGTVFRVPDGGKVQVDKNGQVDLDYKGVGDVLQRVPSIVPGAGNYGNVAPPDNNWNKLNNSQPKKE